MKNQKGITLISVTVYVLGLTVMIAVIATVSSYFYSNTHSVADNINPLTEYTKFNSFFSEEVNHSNIKVLECKEDFIVFDNDVQYTYVAENKGIYRNEVKVARDVESCSFDYLIKNGKDVIIINVTMRNSQEKSIEYTLNS